MATLLIVEDDPPTQSILKRALTHWHHRVLCASNLAEAHRLLKQEEIDLLVLDRGLPDGDGLKICLQLKKDLQTRIIPIIVLTAQSEFADEIDTYKNGADLFLSKPVDLKKLKAYVNGLLERTPFKGEKQTLFRCGELVLDLKNRKARLGEGQLPPLQSRLFNLLYILASYNGRYISRQMLLWKLWKNRVRDKEVDVAVSRLRKKLGPEISKMISSAHGKGYALCLEYVKISPLVNGCTSVAKPEFPL